ncbi:hypothetical protein K0C01_06575 [Salinarchaeum sp. IM2453]|uniref:DUF7097 family protein n=1 Tax=Salinarchaeum sp. IM2453 TaxID=2862870 RepID=UPI001C830FFA|nr:hypothetical protein [Salinarchaeum sp. IM2453]QZA87488.1 hypothetical protein K0C01_06575 [Salinarchaeum sp. IM2453]
MAERSVGTDSPYTYVERCDHVTDDGKCRFAFEEFESDPTFAKRLRDDGYRCPAVDPSSSWTWKDCPNLQSTTSSQECVRCGISERRDGYHGDHPIIEEHHLLYPQESGHEVTVAVCRWCHAKIHQSGKSLADDADPASEALALRDDRLDQESEELSFETAAKRRQQE